MVKRTCDRCGIQVAADGQFPEYLRTSVLTVATLPPEPYQVKSEEIDLCMRCGNALVQAIALFMGGHTRTEGAGA